MAAAGSHGEITPLTVHGASALGIGGGVLEAHATARLASARRWPKGRTLSGGTGSKRNCSTSVIFLGAGGLWDSTETWRLARPL